jgi:hypothetical protein
MNYLKTFNEQPTHRKIGIILFFLSIILFVIFIRYRAQPFLYGFIGLSIVGVLFYMPITYYIFGIIETGRNEDIDTLIAVLRLRATQFKNLSVLIFIITICVVVFSFYLLIRPNITQSTNNFDSSKLNVAELASQIGSVIVLIFLVQILFRVFKYLIRVGAFYNAKADALELKEINPELDVYKLFDSMTPTAYDISDVDSPNLTLKS